MHIESEINWFLRASNRIRRNKDIEEKDGKHSGIAKV